MHALGFHQLLGDETDNRSNTFYNAWSPSPTFTFLLPTTYFVYRATRVCACYIIGRLTKVAHSLVKLKVAVMNFSNSCGSTRCVSRLWTGLGWLWFGHSTTCPTPLGQNLHSNWTNWRNFHVRQIPTLSTFSHNSYCRFQAATECKYCILKLAATFRRFLMNTPLLAPPCSTGWPYRIQCRKWRETKQRQS